MKQKLILPNKQVENQNKNAQSKLSHSADLIDETNTYYLANGLDYSFIPMIDLILVFDEFINMIKKLLAKKNTNQL